jgi:hypothetical protein
MKQKSILQLLREREALTKQLYTWKPNILRGSLIERYKRCGKPNCKCAKGLGHGPKYYLSVTRPGAHPEMDYVPQKLQKKVEEQLRAFKLIRELLEDICNINRELLRRREGF